MRRLVIASHGHFASGLAHTIKLIAGQSTEVHALDAYETNTPIAGDVRSLMSEFAPSDEVVVLTDLLGGSVNQEFSRVAKERPGTVVIAGANLPLALVIIMLPDNEPLSKDVIEDSIAQARDAIVYVNDATAAIGEDDE